jgi:enamine deaminase RidA (YjgF/YER057c/UK114 family)
MTIERINVGPRLSDVAAYNKVAYFAGQVPDDVDEDITGQTRQVLAGIDKLLAQVGSDKSRILQCHISLTDIANIRAMNEVWDAWIPKGNTPPRATVQAQLANPKWKIEIVLSAAAG